MTFHQSLDLTGIIIVVLLVWGITKIPGLLKDVLKQVFKDAILVYVWRHFSGAHYHGRRVTDAGWWSHANNTKRHDFERGTFMDRWEHKPRGHRALWRWAVTFALFGALYGFIFDRAVTIHAIYALFVYLIVALGFVIEMKIRLRAHNRHLLNPIIKSLAAYLRLSPHAVRRMIHIKPENVTDEGETGYFEMPPELTPGQDQQAGIARIIDAHLPYDSEMDFKMEQAPKIGVIQAARKPPYEVLWDETIEAMEHAAYGDIVIGKDRLKNIFTANFVNADDPHWAFCVQSKRGKSNFLGLVACQVLHQDPNAQVIAIDPKRSSLIDYLGSPDYPGPGLKKLLKGVTMANDPTRPDQMVNLIARAKQEFDSRSEEYALDRTKKFPVYLVVIDELNLLREIIKSFWDEVLAANKRRAKEEREDLPGECPIWANIRTLLQAGRFVGIHVIAVAQDLRDDALGGKGARNYFGLRGLGGFHASQWKMLVDRNPVPVAQKGVGRWIFVQGEDMDWVQITYADPEKAYAWASYGRELHQPTVILEGSVLEDSRPSLPASILGTQTDVHAIESDIIVGPTAADAYFGQKEGTFAKARWRMQKAGGDGTIPGEFTVNGRPAWHEADLMAWQASRPGKRRNR